MDGHGHRFPVEEGQLQCQSLSGGGSGFRGGKLQNPHIREGFRPDRGGNGNVSVGLRYPKQIVGIAAGQGQGQLPGGFGYFPGGQHPAVDGQNLHLADGAVGFILKPGGELRGFRFFDKAAHIRSVQLEFQPKIRILGGVGTALPECLQQTAFGLGLCQNHGSGVPEIRVIAEAAGGGSQMPAGIQSLKILGQILGARLSEDLHQLHDPVVLGVIVPETVKGAVGVAGMVELADGTRSLRQGGQVSFQGGQLVPGLPAGGAEGIDMTQAVSLAPGHFIAENGGKIPVRRGLCRLLSFSPAGTEAAAVGIDGTGLCAYKGIAVVGEGEEIHVRFPGTFCVDFSGAAPAAGESRVVVELTGVVIPEEVDFRLRGKGQNFLCVEYALHNDAGEPGRTRKGILSHQR